MNNLRHRHMSGGYTLLEILVVVSIIALLIGFVIAVSTHTVSRTAQTRLAFQALLTIADEYEAQTKGQIVNHDGMRPIDWSQPRRFTNHRMKGTGKPNDPSERFVVGVMQIPQTKDLILNLLSSGVLVDQDKKDDEGNWIPDGFFELKDGWGTMILYRASNVSYDAPDPRLPHHPRRFFSSAGEDMQFGTADDMYSFDIE